MKKFIKKNKKALIIGGLVFGTGGLIASAMIYDKHDDPKYANVVSWFKNPQNAHIWQKQLSTEEVKKVKKIIGTKLGVNIISESEAQILMQLHQKLRI